MSMPGRRGRPMAADVLSDVLRTVRLTGATFFDVVARGALGRRAAAAGDGPAEVLPGADI